MKNPPAFPRSAFAPEGVRSEDCEGNDSQEGMTLRDYFAAKAMQAIIAKSPFGLLNPQSPEDQAKVMEQLQSQLASACNGAYLYADAMLFVRAQTA